ncbi:MAG: hypothetical protein OHK0013_00630 [Sandaracinaceae bacterium]
MRAFATLFVKELRAVFPLALLGFALISGDLISRPLTERIDENTYEHVAGIGPGQGGFLAFVFWLLAFFVAYAAFPREHDERTIEMLYALPVQRRVIFFAKTLAGLVTLWGVAAVGQCTNFVLQAFNPNSIEGHQMHPELVLGVVFLHATIASVLYFHGLFASVFRIFGILPYTFLFFVLVFVEELAPGLAWLNPKVIVDFEYEGSRLLYPWGAIATHGAVAAVVGALAYVGWMGPVDRLRELVAARSTWTTVLLGIGSALVLGGGFVLFVVWVFVMYAAPGRPPPQDPTAERPVAELDFGTAEARTRHYAFIYPAGSEERALRLVRRADRVLEEVGRITGAETLPFIHVDLAEESGHHEGIAAGTRIRMGARGQDDWRLVHVLAHESTHVLQSQLSRRYLMDHGQTTRFFIEGGAEWVAFEALAEGRLGEVLSADETSEEAGLRRSSRIVAAAAWERHRVRLEDTLDDGAFRARFDTTLAYPYGETFAEAVARACGDAAVGATFRTFGREGAPQDAAGASLFRDALASIGCDFELVLSAHDALLFETCAAERATLDAIPRMSGGVVGLEGGEVVIEATLDRAPLPQERYVVRVRNDAGAADTEVRGFHGEIVEGSSPRRVRFYVPRVALTGARFDFLFSLEVDARAFPYSEVWQSAPVP